MSPDATGTPGPPTDPVATRDPLEIQRAHDTLVAVVTAQVDIGIDQFELIHIITALDVLCWTLRHDHNVSFEANLKSLRDAIRDSGYTEMGPTEHPFTIEQLLRDLLRRPS